MRSDSHDTRLRRLNWRSRRGLLELDILLNRFCKFGLHVLTAEDAVLFEVLLEESDMNLLDWLEDRQPTPPVWQPLIERIRASV